MIEEAPALRRGTPQRQYAVKILLDDPEQSKFPIGAQGIAAIYTSGETGAWAALRKVSIRALLGQLALSRQFLISFGGSSRAFFLLRLLRSGSGRLC